MSQLGSSMVAPFTQAGTYLKPTLDVVDPRKWNWPGYLSIKQSSSSSSLSKESVSESDVSNGDGDKSGNEDKTDEDDAGGIEGEFKAHVAAMKRAREEGGEELDAIVPSAAPEQTELPPQANPEGDDSKSEASPRQLSSSDDDLGDHLPLSPPQPSNSLSPPQSPEPAESIIDQDALEDAMLDTTPPHSIAGGFENDQFQYPPLPPSPPPAPPFQGNQVRIRRIEESGETEERSLQYVHVSLQHPHRNFRGFTKIRSV